MKKYKLVIANVNEASKAEMTIATSLFFKKLVKKGNKYGLFFRKDHIYRIFIYNLKNPNVMWIYDNTRRNFEEYRRCEAEEDLKVNHEHNDPDEVERKLKND